MSVTEDNLQAMSDVGHRVMTVADLVANLAALPPMMDVYLDLDGVPMFLNDVQVEQVKEHPTPFLRLLGGVKPKCNQHVIFAETVEEQTARKRQMAMQMANNSEAASKMPANDGLV